MPRRRVLALPLAILLAASALADEDGSAHRPTPDFLGATEPKPKVLLLGVFHFQDAGLDSYKPKHSFEALSERRQAEIAGVVAQLAAFKPTRILIEGDADWQAKADERLQGYLAGTFSIADRPNEIYQLGFRLAKAAGVSRLTCVDVRGREYPDMPQSLDEVRTLARRRNEEQLLDGPWEKRFTALYEHDDEAKSRLPLRDTLVYINSPARLRQGHGHYLTGLFRVGAGSDYVGADNLTGYWYNRNLRIFANILRAAERPDDRLVVIFGAGHLPIIRHAAECSPEIELVEVQDVLGGR